MKIEVKSVKTKLVDRSIYIVRDRLNSIISKIHKLKYSFPLVYGMRFNFDSDWMYDKSEKIQKYIRQTTVALKCLINR